MRALTSAIAIALLGASTLGSARPLAAQTGDSLTITFLANMGVMLSSAGRTVMIDGLFGDGLPDYGVVTPATRGVLQRAAPPFAGVDYVLATHVHRDHFDPASVLGHLRANPRATFISSTQAAERLREADGASARAIGARIVGVDPPRGARRRILSAASVTMDALGLPHGRTRNRATNLGYLIDIGGRRVLHAGDAEFAAADVARLGLGERGVDVALLPFWYLTSSALREVVRRDVRPASIIALHVPPADRERVMREIQAEFPNARAFGRELESIVIR